jgi:hypothetical protein
MHPKRRLSSIFYVFVLLSFWLVGGCAEKPKKPIRLLTIQQMNSGQIDINLPGLIHFTGTGDSLQCIQIPVQDGDLINIDDTYDLVFRDDFPDTLKINFESGLSVNNEIWALDIREFSSPYDSLSNYEKLDLTNLKIININLPFESNEREILEKVKAYKTEVDIQTDIFDYGYETSHEVNEDLRWLFSEFRPHYLSVKGLPDSLDFGILRAIKTLEFLSLDGLPDHIKEGVLPPLPQVKSLMLDSEDESYLSYDFFSNNKQLEDLTCWSLTGTEIHVLNNLKKLTFFTPESFPPYDFGRRHPRLENLNYMLGKYPNFSNLKDLDLSWLTIYYGGDTLGIDLKQLVETQPGLKLFNLAQINEESVIANLSAIRDLNQLEYLLIQKDPLGIDSVIMQMPHLKYLSMPEGYLDDSLRSVALRKALPNTIISANSGFCLGSGWLLLLLPLSLLAFLIQRSLFGISLGKNEA